MATIELMETGFTVIPEGTYIFKVVEAEHKEQFGKVTLKFVTKEGYKHQETFGLKSNGRPNTGAIKAFSAYSRQLLNDPSVQAVEPSELVGHYIQGTIQHETMSSKNNPGEFITFAHITPYTTAPAKGFAETPEESLPGNNNKTPLDF